MVNVTEQDGYFVFEVIGLHKLWSLKSKIKVPKENVVKVYHEPKKLPMWKGWRLPGTHVPFIITAGTYYVRGNRNFWDVVKEKNTIVVELKDEKYNTLFIEVENPEETMRLLNG